MPCACLRERRAQLCTRGAAHRRRLTFDACFDLRHLGQRTRLRCARGAPSPEAAGAVDFQHPALRTERQAGGKRHGVLAQQSLSSGRQRRGAGGRRHRRSICCKHIARVAPPARAAGTPVGVAVVFLVAIFVAILVIGIWSLRFCVDFAARSSNLRRARIASVVMRGRNALQCSDRGLKRCRLHVRRHVHIRRSHSAVFEQPRAQRAQPRAEYLVLRVEGSASRATDAAAAAKGQRRDRTSCASARSKCASAAVAGSPPALVTSAARSAAVLNRTLRAKAAPSSSATPRRTKDSTRNPVALPMLVCPQSSLAWPSRTSCLKLRISSHKLLNKLLVRRP